MIKGKSVLAIIPARGGSKGIPRKNIIDLAGKPLIAWTIVEARKSAFIDRVVVSSDDREIINVAVEWGAEAPFVRPADLARDDTAGIAPILHALQQLPGYDYVVLLQPTSPLRSVDDIDGAIQKCFEMDDAPVVSVSLVEENPWWMSTLGDNGRLVPLMADSAQYVRRQDLPPVYIYNGAVYVATTEYLLREKSFAHQACAYVMPTERSIDIDAALDLSLAELLLKQRDIKFG